MKIKLLDGVEIPEYATTGSAGFDLVAHNFKVVYDQFFGNNEGVKVSPDDLSIKLTPQSRLLVGTGIFVAVPEGHELQIRPRSGNALKTGLSVLNSPGTIDSDYRGEIGVILINTSKYAVEVKLGDKIAQGVLTVFCKADFELELDELPNTQRGEGGFGHTGK